MAHFWCRATSARCPSRARACAHVARENDADVKRECQSLPSGHVHLLISEENRDISHQSSAGHNRCGRAHPQPASSDASLLVPPVRPGTHRALLRLLHPELPPRREAGAAGGWDQTGEDHYAFWEVICLWFCFLFFVFFNFLWEYWDWKLTKVVCVPILILYKVIICGKSGKSGA